MKTGLKRFLGIICLLMLLGPIGVDAKCKCGKPPKEKAITEKVYVAPSDVDIIEKQIFVTVDQQTVPTFAVFSDEGGIYILAAKKRQGRCPEDYWECSTCGGCSPWHAPDCDWCGYD